MQQMKKGSDYDQAEWTVQSVDQPFKLYRIQNVFCDRQYVMNLKEELEKLEFSRNMNDMFSLYQTKNLTDLKNQTKFSMFGKFLRFLEDLKGILSQETNVELEPTISVSASKYCNGDFLLCHDDHTEDRYVAFIYYLNPVWKTDWGGSLDIFDQDDAGQANRIVFSIRPEFNSLIFFQVGNSTYHQVAEVVTDEVPRLTINGWFHSKRALSIEPLPYHEWCMPFVETHDRGALMYLQHFANSDFLNEKSVSLICNAFQNKNVIMLQEFLRPNIFNRVCKELRSACVRWKRKGPANIRRYDVVDETSLPSLTSAFLNFVRSKYMCSYLETISGQNLIQNENGKLVGLVHAEIQSWKGSYYSLLNDDDVHFENDTVEMWLFFNVRKETNADVETDDDVRVQPGGIYYCKKYSCLPEYEIEPADNSVCWVRKNKDESTFVSYISVKSTLQYQALRVCYKM